VRWRLRIDIAKGQHIVVLINDIRGDFTPDHLTKKTVTHRYVSSRLLQLCTIYTRIFREANP
jgi:hypothetical protein